MIYTHQPIPEFPRAKQISVDGQSEFRLYQTPEGKIYPSITSVLHHLSEDVIDEWTERVGEKVAHHESQWGKDRGTVLHDALEKLLRNERIYDYPLLIRMLIKDLQEYLLKIDRIVLQETQVYSDTFQIAGRLDLVSYYNNILSVVDFKGSKRPKRKSWISPYFLQTAFYAYAVYERTGIKIPQLVVLIGTEQGYSQEFIESPKKWLLELKEIREEFRKRNNI